MKIFSARIRQLRKQKKLSQDQLAYLSDTSQSTISKYELETLEPDLQTLKKLCQSLDTTADYLLGLSAKSDKP